MKWLPGTCDRHLLTPCGHWEAWRVEPHKSERRRGKPWRVTKVERLLNYAGYGATPDEALWEWVKLNRALGAVLIEAAEDAEAALDEGVSMGPWRV